MQLLHACKPLASYHKSKASLGKNNFLLFQRLIKFMYESKKRKASGMASKYYAVRTGHRPGVYKTWAECKENVTGFSGAQCK
ncbi:hypothetical protein F5884DRAFT_50167 [Xylogone sp. PMI_703]|nr:hypothetical protein F5884DRAFT_50167 [Xylogone sp. PMI_703]